jgi:ABC-type transport system involved in multi-copper enzyme maturation permease subunit
MFINMINIEFLKYKRSIVPWLVVFGAFLPSLTTVLYFSSEKKQVTWDMLFLTAYSSMNQLALLLFAVITGFVFAGEYHDKTCNILFTSAVSRFSFFISKLFVVLIIISTVYVLLDFFTIALGYTYIKSFPAIGLLYKCLKTNMAVISLNFAIIPITIFICTLFKEIISAVVAGMCLVISYIIFVNSKFVNFILSCFLQVFVNKYFSSFQILSGEYFKLVLITLITFVIGFAGSAYYYCKANVYK